MGDFVATVETALQRTLMTPVEALLPYHGDGSALLSLCHTQGAIEAEEYGDEGMHVMANVPQELANRMAPYSIAPPAPPPTPTTGAASGNPQRAPGGEGGEEEEEEEIDWVALGRGRHKVTKK